MTPPSRPNGPVARLAGLLRTRLLPRLPGRIAQAGDATLRRFTLRRLRARGARPSLIVSHDLSRSGAPLLVLEIARTLRAEGHDILVLSLVGGPFLKDLLADGFKVVIDRNLATSGYLGGLAQRTRIAICNTVETAAVVKALSAHVPTLWYLHEVSLLDERLADPAVRQAVQGAVAIWAGSPMCAEKLTDIRPDLTVVPYGVAPLGAPSPPRDSQPFTIGVFGSIESRKGQDLAVEAVRLLPPAVAARVCLRLYGRILEPDFARMVIAGLHGIPAQYLGELDRADYMEAMDDVDAVLVSSRDDTLPIVSIDALGLGKLLLMTPSVGTGHWLQNGEDALIAAETSASGIANMIVKAESEADRPRMSEAARRAFDQQFSAAAFRASLLRTAAALENRR